MRSRLAPETGQAVRRWTQEDVEGVRKSYRKDAQYPRT
jgi:hypothetical protein